MLRTAFVAAFAAAAVFLPCSSEAQLTTTTAAGPVEQAFAVTTSVTAAYTVPSGAMQPMPATLLNISLKYPSMLIVTFSARGVVAPPSSGATIPIVFVNCEIDGVPCQPNGNTEEFLYPQYCCDTRSFTWIVHSAAAGAHTVRIVWGMGNPTAAYVTNRTLAIQAARLERKEKEPKKP